MSNFNPKLEETIIVDFITSSPTTGAAADADSTPGCAVYEDTNDTALITPTVVKRTSLTGNYRVPVACTAANGFEAAKSYSVVIAATVGGVAAKAIAANFMMRTRGVDDLATPTNITAGTITTVATTTNLTNLPNIPANWITAAGITAAAMNGKGDWNIGKTGYALTAPYDPAKTAATQTSVDTIDDFLDTEVAAIKAKTDQLTFTVANQLDSNVLTIAAAQLTAIADAMLKRDMSAVTGESARSLLNAIRFLRNKWTLAAGTLTVTKEDDTTSAWTAAVSTDAAAVPIIGSDPA